MDNKTITPTILNVYILYAFQQFISYFYFTWDLQVSLTTLCSQIYIYLCLREILISSIKPLFCIFSMSLVKSWVVIVIHFRSSSHIAILKYVLIAYLVRCKLLIPGGHLIFFRTLLILQIRHIISYLNSSAIQFDWNTTQTNSADDKMQSLKLSIIENQASFVWSLTLQQSLLLNKYRATVESNNTV